MSSKNNLALVSFVGAMIFAATALVVTTTNSNANAIVGSAGTTSTTIIVHAGGGNATNMLAAFVPPHAQISVGQSVTWDNPSPVAATYCYLCI